MERRITATDKKTDSFRLLLLIILFETAAFIMLAFRYNPLDTTALLIMVMYSALLVFQYTLFSLLFRNMDRNILIISQLLTTVGLIVQYRISADIAFHQLFMIVIGTFAMLICMLLMRKPNIFRRLNWLLVIISLGLLVLLTAVGQEQGGAKNWMSIAGQSFQPSEFVKVAMVFVLAHWLANAIEVRKIWPMFIFVFIVTGLLVVQRDLGAALLMAGTALIVFYSATGRKLLTFLGLGIGGLGAIACYYLFDHVKARVAIWQNPWATYSSSGYQIVQGLMAIASGGPWGVGLTRGLPKLIPAYHTDYIFAVVCEEFGIIFGLCLIALYLVLIIRGATIATDAPDRFTMLVAFGCTTLLALQAFIIIAGVIKLIPLTGITLPFVSYGGSSMIACMMLLGILEGVAVLSRENLAKTLEEFK